jgi:hypothetical protein
MTRTLTYTAKTGVNAPGYFNGAGKIHIAAWLTISAP